MNAILAGLLSRGRSLLLLLAFLLIAGLLAYRAMPKEAAPDVDIPIFYVTVTYPGVSAADAERLLLEPLERELQQINGLDEMVSHAGEGFATVQLEFAPGYSNRDALMDVQREVDAVTPDLPAGADQPIVNEINLDLFPILGIALSGPLDERALLSFARELQDRLERIDGVLEAAIRGEREELMEVLIDPTVMETYQISFQEVSSAISRNNQLVPVGSVHAGAGRIGIVVPGTIEDRNDVMQTAVRVQDGTVITVADVAEVREGFTDPDSFARLNGERALTLEVRPRSGANVLNTVAQVLEGVEELRPDWPGVLQVTLLQNQAEQIETNLGDLQNTVLIAMILVALTIVAALGLRASLLVASAVPGAFLMGLLTVALMGFTLNIVVLFSLILVVGMLVDGAVVVVELADRYLAEGETRATAFLRASQRMAWPIATGVATTIAVFVPMLFWPGMVGEFIIYLPATVIVTLIASLVMALVFVPALGQVLGPVNATEDATRRRIQAAEEGRFDELDRRTARYVRGLRWLCLRPKTTLFGTLGLMAVTLLLYGLLGRGVEFFPRIEPEFLQLQVHARGSLSVWEADALVRETERRVAGLEGVKAINSQTIADQQMRLQQNLSADTVGLIRLELVHWRQREPAAVLTNKLRELTRDLPGLDIQIREQESGPAAGAPIVLELFGDDRAKLLRGLDQVRGVMAELGGFMDVQDDRPLPGVELRLRVNREEAGRYGADVATLGQAVQMLTDGVLLGVYRPPHSDDEVDIRMRFPLEHRNVEELARLRVPTAQGMMPMLNFVQIEPTPGTGLLKRTNARPAYQIEAYPAPGHNVNEQLKRLAEALPQAQLPEGVNYQFRGQAEDQAETGQFLILAFLAGVFLMFMILVTQFDSLRQASLVMTAIVFSSVGVLLGLMIRQEPFNLVMSGIGVLSLAGIVVNNNIVLIDTYNVTRASGVAPLEAALRTGAQRLRPIILTAVTTVFGLIPMVLALTIDLVARDIYFGAPSTQWWVALATAIAGGLTFATPLTLLFTPAMLVWLDRRRAGGAETVQ